VPHKTVADGCLDRRRILGGISLYLEPDRRDVLRRLALGKTLLPAVELLSDGRPVQGDPAFVLGDDTTLALMRDIGGQGPDPLTAGRKAHHLDDGALPASRKTVDP